MKAVTVYKAWDDAVFPTKQACIRYEALLDGRSHKCPQCNTKGYVNGDPIKEQVYDSEATGYGGQFAQPVYKEQVVGYKDKTCPTCSGAGYTTEKKGPVYSKKVTGYK